MLEAKRHTIQIIGGGILGVLVAHLAAEQGYPVRVYRVEDSEIPNADSLRNHAWLQSGLLYAGKLPNPILRQMRQSGIQLLEKFGFPIPPLNTRGIFCLDHEDQAKQFIEDAKELRFGSKVTRMPEFEAKTQLGAFFAPDRPYFWVPDAPFQEGRIIAAARDQAEKMGAQFINVKNPVKIKLEKSSPSGVVVDVDGKLTTSHILILAAGSRTKLLLKQIGHDYDLVVSQSPLLVMPGCEMLNTPLFVNRSTGLSVIRHTPSQSCPEGCLVIGNSHRRKIEEGRIDDIRLINSDDMQTVEELLPSELLKKMQSNGLKRYTAGYKTEYFRPGIGCTVQPWIESLSNFPGVFAAIPGKATMALFTAQNLLLKIKSFVEKPKDNLLQNLKFGHPLLPIWSGPVPLHHEAHYDKMNDARPQI